MARPAKRLGRYHVLDEIGRGSVAPLYRAWAPEDGGRVVALELLYGFDDDTPLWLFLEEDVHTARSVTHGNLAHIHEIVHDGHHSAIVREHVDGKDVHAILERCSARDHLLPAAYAAYIAAEIAAALHVVHDAGIVHRMVCPENIACGYAGEVKLTELGMARFSSSIITKYKRSSFGYLSPEQARGLAPDPRSDIFSLGACLYAMLTCRGPFEAQNDFDTLLKIRDVQVQPIGDVVAGLPSELEAICSRCLVRKPDGRYQYVEEIEADLRAFLRRVAPGNLRAGLGTYLGTLFEADRAREQAVLDEFVPAD